MPASPIAPSPSPSRLATASRCLAGLLLPALLLAACGGPRPNAREGTLPNAIPIEGWDTRSEDRCAIDIRTAVLFSSTVAWERHSNLRSAPGWKLDPNRETIVVIALGRADSQGATMRLASGSAHIVDGELQLPVRISRPWATTQAQRELSSCLYVRVPVAYLARVQAFDEGVPDHPVIASGRVRPD